MWKIIDKPYIDPSLLLKDDRVPTLFKKTEVILFAIFWSHFYLAEIWGKYFRVVLFYFFILGVQFGTSLYTLGWLLHGFASINGRSLGLHAGVISSYDDSHIII